MSKACSPWGKEQVVVMLSRTHSAKDTIIVGDREFAVGKMWDLITVGTKWSRYVEDLLKRVSIGGSQSTVRNGAVVTPEAYPFRISDMSLPDDDSGFVYFLVLVRDCGRTYIGQTTSISQRLKKHNSGWGAKGTAEPQYRPYAVAAYICGLSHMDKRGREGLEHKWKEHILEEKRRGMTDVYTWVLQGDRVVQSYNDYHLNKENHIRLVVTISRSSL
jgi:predicted GIY-YIG superfamily endonuclease